MKIIVDAMGGDNAPIEIVRGAILAAEEFGAEIILTGRGEDILRSVEAIGKTTLPLGMEIVNATEVIEMCDDPVTAIREKRDSSMVVGLRLLYDGAGDAMVSAGSTGALLSGATLIVKRVRGIRRAALAPVVPNKAGGFVIIDCGANVECTAEYLLQFAFMGSYYAESALGCKKPRVGLLNNGTERTKGTPLQIEAFALLENAGRDGFINFVGNVEGKEIMLGACDVVVCDGFSGNILLKSLEGAASFLLSEVKGIFTKNAVTKLSALLLKNGIRALRERMDPDKVGGTALVGIAKPVIKAHGSSGARAICSAIRQAQIAANAGIAEKLQENIGCMKIGE
ncbi:MAG: phosphate acyltransferase PlsX [Oscillospiraceae bacterium]|jgi:glycerol-3-phosphate acyltransferase PlsX|nr:phosphate acyltransferase PlsX [Oscillospiraceae bacterium]